MLVHGGKIEENRFGAIAGEFPLTALAEEEVRADSAGATAGSQAMQICPRACASPKSGALKSERSGSTPVPGCGARRLAEHKRRLDLPAKVSSALTGR